MPDKPTTATGYRSEQAELVRATCLYVATKLGDIMDDLVVVGGLVPSLLIDQDNLPEGVDAHVGTVDLDVGLTLALLDEGRYQALAERMRRAGFEQDATDKGTPTRQRWRIVGPEKVTVDFLIEPSHSEDQGGTLRDIEHDFAAVITPGLQLAFQDAEPITLSGKTIRNEQVTRGIQVCGPGAYVVLKSLAFRGRGENKDAYDLYYLLRSYGAGVNEIASRLLPLRTDSHTTQAIDILKEDFQTRDGVGPLRVAEFLLGRPDDEIQVDVVGFVGRLLRECGQ